MGYLRQLAKAWTKLGAAQYPGIEVAPGAREPASEILIEKHDVTHACGGRGERAFSGC